MTDSQKPDCYKCVHRGTLPGSAHSKCIHPSMKAANEDPLGKLIGIFGKRAGNISLDQNPINVTGDDHGKRHGWFNWPWNFDPTWLESCDGFEALEKKENDHGQT